MSRQIILRDGKVLCTTTVPYPPKVVKQMKNAGYKIKEDVVKDNA